MSRRSATRRFARLAVQTLETRLVPANNLSIVPININDSAFVKVSTQGHTITIETKVADAILSLSTLQDALSQTQGNRDEVIVTTDVANGGTDGHQAGNIAWDGSTSGNLDFTGFVTGRTLTFRTVAGLGAVGNIDLTAVQFQTGAGGENINLNFDTTATNGSVGFHADAGGNTTVSFDDASVVDLTVTAGTGGFTYENATNAGSATAGGDVSIAAGAVTIGNAGGITAFGDITVTADTVSLTANTGFLATGNLAVTGTTSVTANTAPLTSENGSVAVTGGTLILSVSDLSALTTVTVNGTDSIAADSATAYGSGDVQFTSNGSVTLNAMTFTPGGNLTVSGTDVLVSGNSVEATGDLSVIGSSSVAVDSFSLLSGTNVSITSPGALTVTDTDLNATANTTLSGSDVSLANGTYTVGGDLSVAATNITPTVLLTDVTLAAGGNLSLTGAVQLGGSLVTVNGFGRNSAVSFSSNVDGATDLLVVGATVSFGGDLGGTTPLGTFTLGRGVADLGTHDLSAAFVFVGDGSFDPFGEATLGGRGLITLTGDLITPADLTVLADGNLAPGGLGTTGTLTVQGNVVFDGGDFAVDLGNQSDLLKVRDNPATTDPEGNVNIGIARLGGGLGTGTLPAGSSDVQLIDYIGTLTGEFFNAPLDTPVLAGTDAIQVTNYGPAALGMTVAPVDALPGGVFNTADPDDGTLITVKLTGGGQLVGGTDWGGQLFLVARNTTPASILTITTKANGGDTVGTFAAGILVNGPLAAFTAPRINIGDQFRATGAVKTASFRDLFPQDPNGPSAVVEFGGSLTSTTSITARNVFGNVKVAGVLTKLTAATGAIGSHVNETGFEDSLVTAASIGTIKAQTIRSFIRSAGKVGTVTATGDFFGGLAGTSLTKLSAGGVTGSVVEVKVAGPITTITGTGSALFLDMAATSVGSVTVSKGILSPIAGGWNVTNGIGVLTAAAIDNLNLTARYLGTVKATGTPDIGGFISDSTFTLTGNDGSLGLYGIKSLTAAGTVTNSTFNAKGGNVGPVKVGRFLSSRLYLNYTPPASTGIAFNTGGAFGSTGFMLTSFATTAVPTPDPLNPLNWAYQNSEVAADMIGAVTLSGVNTDNAGVGFGIKVHKPGATLMVKAADASFPSNRLGTLISPANPNNPPLGLDFFFVRV